MPDCQVVSCCYRVTVCKELSQQKAHRIGALLIFTNLYNVSGVSVLGLWTACEAVV